MQDELHDVASPTPARSGSLAVRIGVAASAAIAASALAYGMLTGPVHATSDAAGCDRAYAEARTRQDSLEVNLMSYPDAAGRTRLCGMLHQPVVDITRR